MKVTILTNGTRGDVQPFLTLANALRKEGHHPTVLAHLRYKSLLRPDVDLVPLQRDPKSFFAGAAGLGLRQRLRKTSPDLARFWRAYISPLVRAQLTELWPKCPPADLIVCEPWLQAGPTLSELFKVPCVIGSVFPIPAVPTMEFAFPFFEEITEHPTCDEIASSWQFGKSFAELALDDINYWRTNFLGLRAASWSEYYERTFSLPHLFAYSSHVLPKPGDWMGWHHVAGYFFHTEPNYIASRALLDFLDAGPPPIVFGFSSQASTKKAELTKVIMRALDRAHARAVLLSGWGAIELGLIDRNVFVTDSVPYEWLLPRCSSMVHHGGTGTTGECLRAGIPSLALPLGYDGRFWGARLAKLGAALEPINAEGLTAEVVSNAIVRLSEDKSIKMRARELQSAINTEDSISAAIRILERLQFGQFHQT